jgi:hypothetical protein
MVETPSRERVAATGTSRRALQVVIVVLAVIPVLTGLLDAVGGPGLLLPGHPKVDPNVDSNYRFFAVFWFTAGLALLWTVPRVERATVAIRVLFGAVFLGGIARLLSLASAGWPDAPFIGFIVLEFVAPPVVIFWQSRIAAGAGRAAVPTSER